MRSPFRVSSGLPWLAMALIPVLGAGRSNSPALQFRENRVVASSGNDVTFRVLSTERCHAAVEPAAVSFRLPCEYLHAKAVFRSEGENKEREFGVSRRAPGGFAFVVYAPVADGPAPRDSASR